MSVLTEGKVGKVLIKFAYPFLIANFLQALYGAADLFVVGQYADPAAVSAVSIGSQVMQTITAIVLGLSMGGTVLIGRYIGAKDSKNAANTIGTMTVSFSVLAIVLTAAMLCLCDAWVAIMQTPAEAVALTKSYILICSCGILFIVGYNGVSAVFRGIGDSKTPVYFIGLACLINIVVDFILVGGFHLSAAGAAIATVAAQAVSFLASLLYIRKKGFAFQFTKQHIKINRGVLKQMLKIGVPIALQDSLISISFLIITAIINTMGLMQSAAVGVVEKLIVFAMLPPSAFASATATVTAQNIGAKKPERAKKAVGYGIGYSLVFGISVFIFAQIAPEMLTSVFSNNKQVITIAAAYLRSYSFDCVLVCFVFNLNSYFNGCGKSVISMVHSIAATFLLRIPMSYLLSKIEGVTLFEIGFAAPTATMLSLIICIIFFIRLSRKNGNQLNVQKAPGM